MQTNDINLIEEAWLGLEPDDIKSLAKRENPLFKGYEDWYKDEPGLFELELMAQPEYLHFACEALLHVKLLPIQNVILQELWTRPFPMFIASRGFGKSFMLSVLSLLKAVLIPGSKVVVVGAAFRQSKVLFEYMTSIWNNASRLRSVCAKSSGPRINTDVCTMHINDSWIKCIPLGTGEKIRGLRAHTIISDEFASISPDIYETVVQGFASVSASPFDNVKAHARRKALQEAGKWSKKKEEEYLDAQQTNQIIISGTADYDFKHFADYWRKYKGIIESYGNPEEYYAYFGEDDNVLDSFEWKDYSIIRIPYELIPKGFMDDKVIARAKATVHSGTYLNEYGACFSKDSGGFFKRSLIEGCVTSDKNPVELSTGSVWFDAATQGNPSLEYVYGIDPGAEIDNFAIVIIELHGDHNRVVHCWTTNKDGFKARAKAGLTNKTDYYSFCIRKIRDLMKIFPCRHIALDAQGGGNMILEGLHDADKMEEGERPIYEIINPDKGKDTDDLAGLHIVEMIQFAKYDWVYESNSGLRKDMEDKFLLFPRFDSLSLELANAADKIKVESYEREHKGKTLMLFDTMEDCVMEIEELKNELTTIVTTMTGTGVQSRIRWDTPETKGKNGRKGHLRKDRYSALLMASMAARQMVRKLPQKDYYQALGGFSYNVPKSDSSEMYHGPDWFTKGMNNLK